MNFETYIYILKDLCKTIMFGTNMDRGRHGIRNELC